MASNSSENAVRTNLTAQEYWGKYIRREKNAVKPRIVVGTASNFQNTLLSNLVRVIQSVDGHQIKRTIETTLPRRNDSDLVA